jgi:hypothetical protein
MVDHQPADTTYQFTVLRMAAGYWWSISIFRLLLDVEIYIRLILRN